MEQIIENVYYVGSNDQDRKIFDELMPLSEGTTYNSYLIIGSEKTAIIDTVYPEKKYELIDKLVKNNIKIDYIISNHAEQDHSGSIPALIEHFKDARIVTNEKVANNLYSLLNISLDKIDIINDGDTLSLGDKTLQFKLAPFVHWPDTMFTYLIEDKMLFTCDFLGAHRTKSGLFAENSEELAKLAKKYFSEIIMPFRKFAKQYTQYVKDLNVNMVLPSHGPIYNKPEFILDLYDDWTSDEPKKLVIIAYVSMYNSIRSMSEYLKNKLKDNGVNVKIFDLMRDDLSELVENLVDASTIVFGSSMVLAQAHPNVILFSNLVNILKPRIKNYAILGSYGWGGNLEGSIEKMLTNIKPQKLDSIIFKGVPKNGDFKQLDTLALKIKEVV